MVWTKEFLEKNSEEKNWKTRTNTDDSGKPDAFLSLFEAGGFNLSRHKEYVRSYIYEIRSNLSDDDVEERSRSISENLTTLERFKISKKIALFCSVRNEVDIRGVFSESLKAGKEVYFPRVNGASLTFHRAGSLEELRPGKFGIPEPAPDSFSAAPESLDLVIVPGVAFDSAGNRLGYGKGYYDRTLVNVSEEKRIALSYGFQVLDSVPGGELDLGVGLIVTEAGIIFCSRLKGGN